MYYQRSVGNKICLSVQQNVLSTQCGKHNLFVCTTKMYYQRSLGNTICLAVQQKYLLSVQCGKPVSYTHLDVYKRQV